jgi:hypothetical protein
MAVVGAAAAIIPLTLAAWWSVRSRALPAGVGVTE